MVAYAYAARYPDKVERLVVMDRTLCPTRRAMRAWFAQFAAFPQDVEDNKIFQRTKLTMPVSVARNPAALPKR
jgi:pimeloyl-ACP methyl ester carboxylesterase